MKKKINDFLDKPLSTFGLIVVILISLPGAFFMAQVLSNHNIIIPPAFVGGGGIEWTYDMMEAGAFDVPTDSTHNEQLRK